MLDNKTIYQLVLKGGLAPQSSLDPIFREAERQKKLLDQILLEKNLVGKNDLGQALANSYNLPYIDLSQLKIKEEILKLIPKLTAQKYQVVVFDKDQTGVKIAARYPDDQSTIQFLNSKLEGDLKIYYTTALDIQSALKLYQGEAVDSFSQLIKLPELSQGKSPAEAPIEEIVQKLFEYALDNRASDVHIEPYRNKIMLRFRIDGIMHDVANLPKDLHTQIVARIKVLSNLRTDEHRAAQDGKLKVEYNSSSTDVRVSVVPSINGENVVLRILSEKSRQFNLENIGLSEENIATIKKEISKSWGMILAVGPTGSGKTTTLYAILKLLNHREIKISTIEDPVEYDIEGISQIQVDAKKKLTFANGLRSLVRQDPDVIMVGEIRDEETAKMAVNSGMTGHLVLSTLHANDAVTTLPRLLEMNIEPYILASTINLIIAQRIVRKICDKCRQSYQEKTEALQKYLPAHLFKQKLGDKAKVTLYRGAGCGQCHQSGYLGRVGIYELLVVGSEIEKLVMEKANASVIAQKAIELGMKTMLEDGLDKVLEGITTLDEVAKVTRE